MYLTYAVTKSFPENLDLVIKKGFIVAGVSTVAILAASAITPLLMPAVAGKLTIDTAVSWLAGLGSNALASWLDTWGRKHGEKLFSKASDQKLLLELLSTDLDAAITQRDDIASDVANLLTKIDALTLTVQQLAGHIQQQSHLIERLNNDLASQKLHNTQLHDWTKRLVRTIQPYETFTAKPEDELEDQPHIPSSDAKEE